ncbi:hypothetical protein [Vibrio sp. HN007]|uniref:hypothetical protein n=1 Tax=Vibrio iocasae TaxID=3098914 RepID=UPI0035D4D6C7
MSDIYKIETYSESCAGQIAGYINNNGGACVVLGWSIVTDYVFNSQQSLELLPSISCISDDVSEHDIYCWSTSTKVAA